MGWPSRPVQYSSPRFDSEGTVGRPLSQARYCAFSWNSSAPSLNRSAYLHLTEQYQRRQPVCIANNTLSLCIIVPTM